MAHIPHTEEALSDVRATHYVGHPARIEDVELPAPIHPDLAVQPVKISPSDQSKGGSSPMHSSRGASISTSLDHPSSDAASVQSILPEVLVTEPESYLQQAPAAAGTIESSNITSHPSPSPSSSPSPSPNPSTQEEGPLSQQQRRARRRSTADTRASNRLSGFFTNLIHRRDTPTNSTSRNAIREDPSPSTPTPTPTPGHSSETPSRASSPPPGRPATPPPSLPAPTLQELGLSLSVLTLDLSPSHFSTPPSSGAFLAPHFLLLCHAQGLDVLPLVSPPAPQPYALVRRVNFKSVVVMEQRGVLVAIAGRRDGVRVYALEEVKKAIEWRIEMEVRRERDRSRRETVKKLVMNSLEHTIDSRDSADKTRKASLSTPPPGDHTPRSNVLRKSSHGPVLASLPPPPPPPPPATPPAPLIPRTPTPRGPKKPKTPQLQIPSQIPTDRPPPYSSPSELTHPPRLQRQPSTVSFVARSRSGSVSNVLAAVPRTIDPRPHDPDAKADWAESSDDEAIDIVAAGSSGSQALDERTSVTLSAGTASAQAPGVAPAHTTPPRASMGSTRRNRPSNLDLTLTRSATVAPPEPSPAPTLITLRQALSHSPPTLRNIHTGTAQEPDTPFGPTEDDDDDGDDGISLAQVLLESRIPDLPPVGTRRPQEPILLSSTHTEGEPPSSPRTSEGHVSLGHRPPNDGPQRRRRRWSTLLGGPSVDVNGSISPSPSTTPSTAPLARERPNGRFSRSQSFRSNTSHASTIRPSTSSNDPPTGTVSSSNLPGTREATPSIISSQSSRSSRFIPRLISNAFNSRRSDEQPALPIANAVDPKKIPTTPLTPHAPPLKLEYVKLPGTKGALMVKSVETAKKSFLAILCGENGEKVELFAGTYRTALGLSRTFILPDSPRSLELQLQGDDLVEVFLVFSQNVFGLEPATVRVREVRIGRAERRAARRRAREVRVGENISNDSEALAEEDTNVNVSIGVSVSVGSTATSNVLNNRSGTPPLIAAEHPDAQPDTPAPAEPVTTTLPQAEELVAVATAQMGPYTTFQQLNFAPKFPLASIADEYIIPPTYPSFLEYRAEHEPEDGSSTDLTQIQFSPPGLPVPVPTAPSRWYYRDPKNVVHGPWKASLMQAWYKDGLLPPDLPVRREEDDTYILLKDLRLQSIDPTHPFRCPPPPPPTVPAPAPAISESEKPLLPPISLLSQPHHFGPPALFFSSRGGHSTAIVDSRGRSVLKGRFIWSSDEQDEDSKPVMMGRMGDIKRLEALDVDDDRSVLVAMRQGGLEAVDLSDALLRPADESRTVLPQFVPSVSNINRRAPFVWKIGTPVSSSPTTATVLSSKGKGNHSHLPSRKTSTGPTKSPASRSEFSLGDAEMNIHDEVLFLGRKDDEIYFCERNAGSFRILRLCPSVV